MYNENKGTKDEGGKTGRYRKLRGGERGEVYRERDEVRIEGNKQVYEENGGMEGRLQGRVIMETKEEKKG